MKRTVPRVRSGLRAPAKPELKTSVGFCAEIAAGNDLSAFRWPMPVRRIWTSGREATAALKGPASSLTAKQTSVTGEGGIPVKSSKRE